jgi:hypothetical protein
MNDHSRKGPAPAGRVTAGSQKRVLGPGALKAVRLIR